MTDDTEGKGFVIKDKRRFDEDGDTRKETAEEKKEAPDQEENIRVQESQTETPHDDAESQLPEITFAGFILSLHTSALFHFGELEDPVTKEKKKNLSAAKQTIDMLSMLRDKTLGNLEDDETKLLDGILYELRMRYVRETQ